MSGWSVWTCSTSPHTLERYLRGIVAATRSMPRYGRRGPDPIRAIEHFLAQIAGTGRDTGQGVGLGEEVLLRGDVAGIGLVYERSLGALPCPST